MTFLRREVLATFGVASASSLLWVLGCAHPPPPRAPQASLDVRTWLRDAVARLAAMYPAVHALAVSRTRTTAALDVLGAGIARLRTDAALLTVRLADGTTREQLTTNLTADAIAAAATDLGAPRRPAAIDFGPAPPPPDAPPPLDEPDIRRRLDRLLETDADRSSRIVYAAGLLDVDDATVWSVAPRRDLEQRLTRLCQTATRAAWNGPRPVVATAENAWTGQLDGRTLSPADIAAAGDAALKLTTPGYFPDGHHAVVLDPTITALLLDTAANQRLTTAHRSSATNQLGRAPDTAGRALAAPIVTLVDDPTAPGAYGGFTFDDEGTPAAPLTVIDAGRITTRAPRARRPGHVGPIETSTSHLVLRPGSAETTQLYADGFALDAGLAIDYDPATDRVRIPCARARETRAGSPTGRIYADVELVGTLTALLTAIDAIARDPDDHAIQAGTHREPRWRSVSTPAVRTRGLVRARRR